ncbi:Transposase [Oopsacas minuta]|uniref:Transposase n=1 Tax=Oopsacas minuta TaxID=111878 RepID=A0AAV7JG96_9METZ|nr:Transposase [Oopsacas minuta]
MRCCRNLLKSYKECNPRRLFEIVTGDETWVQYNTPISKQVNKVWIGKQLDPPMMPLPNFRSSMIMYCIFLMHMALVAQVIIAKGQTVTGSFYASNCLGVVEESLLKRRKRTGAKGLRLLHDNARTHKTKQVKEIS